MPAEAADAIAPDSCSGETMKLGQRILPGHLMADGSGNELTLALLGLACALFVGTAAIMYFVRRFRRANEDDTPEGKLAFYRAMLRSGELQQEEYDRICRLLGAAAHARPPKDRKSPETRDRGLAERNDPDDPHL